MPNNISPEIHALQHVQIAIDTLSDIYHKDTEIISAIRDLEFGRSRIIDTIKRGK